jgi:hypothetical protein
MRELWRWCISAVILTSLWCGLFLLIRATAHIPPNEPPEAFGVGGMEFIPLLVLLGLVTVGFGIIAFIRTAFVAIAFIAKVGPKTLD